VGHPRDFGAAPLAGSEFGPDQQTLESERSRSCIY
jgi:hypothetical protein